MRFCYFFQSDALSGKVNVSDIIDNLTSTATNKPLSANQGTVLKTSVSNGKTLVASAITDKGVETASDATFATMAENISKISASPTDHFSSYAINNYDVYMYPDSGLDTMQLFMISVVLNFTYGNKYIVALSGNVFHGGYYYGSNLGCSTDNRKYAYIISGSNGCAYVLDSGATGTFYITFGYDIENTRFYIHGGSDFQNINIQEVKIFKRSLTTWEWL